MLQNLKDYFYVESEKRNALKRLPTKALLTTQLPRVIVDEFQLNEQHLESDVIKMVEVDRVDRIKLIDRYKRFLGKFRLMRQLR